MDEFRSKGGIKAARVAIIANCILTILNVAVGLVSGSYALISEGAHTLYCLCRIRNWTKTCR